jgi:hypothetical protein
MNTKKSQVVKGELMTEKLMEDYYKHCSHDALNDKTPYDIYI